MATRTVLAQHDAAWHGLVGVAWIVAWIAWIVAWIGVHFGRLALLGELLVENGLPPPYWSIADVLAILWETVAVGLAWELVLAMDWKVRMRMVAAGGMAVGMTPGAATRDFASASCPMRPAGEHRDSPSSGRVFARTLDRTPPDVIMVVGFGPSLFMKRTKVQLRGS